MDPETRAGTDQIDIKEQARLAMLRARDDDGSTDAEVRNDEADEADDEIEDEDEQEAADPEAADEADDGEESEDEVEDDGSSGVAEGAATEDKAKNKRKSGKVAKLYKSIDELKKQNADLQESISAEVERALAAKAEADAALQQMVAEQEEDNKRIGQVRDYVHRLRGTDQELDRLTRDIASTEDLDPLALTEEQRKVLKQKKARLNQILSARDVVDLATEYADAELKDRVSGILGEFARSLPGVDKDFHQKLKFGPAIQHVYDAALQRGQSESASTIAKLEKQVADLEGKLLAAKAQKRPPMGRVADGGSSIAPKAPSRQKSEDEMTPMERLAAKGAFSKDGRIDPEFRRKLKLGQVSLAG